jgi:SAM-dependent methyltransferase
MNSKEQEAYWSSRWEAQNTPWDMGSVSPPLTAYLQQLTNKEQHILIPGAGSGYEFSWLWANGFKNTYVLDIASEPLQALEMSIPEAKSQLLHTDFFAHEGQYDLIVEQTFFCALPPALRPLYAAHMHTLLKPGGKLVGLLFDFPLSEQGPPYGGSYAEYIALFSAHFRIEKLNACYNSIKPRAGRELFFSFIKPL